MSSSLQDPWLAYRKARLDARRRLFCFPYAGGGASVYRLWADVLPADVEVCPVQLPGRETRLEEPLYIRLCELVDTLARVLQPYLDLPFAFFGHSIGALVSFELARELRRRHSRIPARLFVSASRAPQLGLGRRPIHDLPEPEFVERLRLLGGTPLAVLDNAEMMGLLSPMLRADFQLLETYSYVAEAPLTCPISAMAGQYDPEVSSTEVSAWQEQTQDLFTLRVFAGDHFFVNTLRQGLLQAIAEDLR